MTYKTFFFIVGHDRRPTPSRMIQVPTINEPRACIIRVLLRNAAVLRDTVLLITNEAFYINIAITQ